MIVSIILGAAAFGISAWVLGGAYGRNTISNEGSPKHDRGRVPMLFWQYVAFWSFTLFVGFCTSIYGAEHLLGILK